MKITIFILILTISQYNCENNTIDYFKYTGLANISFAMGNNATLFQHLNETKYANGVVYDKSFEDERYFPKCCGTWLYYDLSQRSCTSYKHLTRIYNELKYNVNLVKTGLKNCKVTIDYPMEKNDFEKLVYIGENATITYDHITYPLGRYCLDNTVDDRRVLRVCVNSDYCEKEKCIKKCCPDGEIFHQNHSTKGQHCYSNYYTNGFDVRMDSNLIQVPEKYAVYNFNPETSIGRPCDLAIMPAFNYTIDDQGVLISNSDMVMMNYIFDSERYCLETLQDRRANVRLHLFVCLPRYNFLQDDWFTQLSYYAWAVSGLCLLFTMIYYVLVFKMKKVIHLVTASYCLAYMIGPIAYYSLDRNINELSRYRIYMIIFERYATTAWINIMSYNTWKGLRSLKQDIGDMTLENIQKYLYYSIYGWMVPCIFTVVVWYDANYRFLIETVGIDRKHFFTYYMLLPNVVSTVVNIILFGLTVYYIIDTMRAVHKCTPELVIFLSSVTMKLFLLMGLGRTLAIFWKLLQLGNAAQLESVPPVILFMEGFEGIAIFLSLYLKWRTLKLSFGKLRRLLTPTVIL